MPKPDGPAQAEVPVYLSVSQDGPPANLDPLLALLIKLSTKVQPRPKQPQPRRRRKNP
jgi:hypothetical protein